MIQAAEVFPVGEYVLEELEARGWSIAEMARRMGGDFNLNHCAIELVIYVHDPDAFLGEDLARRIGLAFGTSAEVWLNLDNAWREWCKQNPEAARKKINGK